MSAILSFLGGNAFRLIFGEITAYLTKRQDQKLELERLRLQNEIDAAWHERQQAAIRLQAELGIKTISAQAQAFSESTAASAWSEAVAAVGRSTGIKFIDTWNGAIRPALASLAMAVVVFEIVNNGFILSDWNRELFGAILGIYVADRSLARRGK